MTEFYDRQRAEEAAANLKRAEQNLLGKLTTIETRLTALEQSSIYSTLLLERIRDGVADLSKGLGVY